MHSIDVVLMMLLLVLASGYVVRMLPFALPLPLVQIALGAGVAAGSSHAVKLDPHVFFLLFLPPLLFLDGWRIPKEGLFRDARPILQLALGLVVFTVLGAGFLIHWLIPSMPLAVAFALAAVVSPTDPIAVSSIAARVPVPHRLMHILEGEALLNDASGLVLFRFAVVAALTGRFVPGEAALVFLWLALGGLAIGVLVTLAISRGHSRLTRRFGQDAGVPILGSLLMPFAAYLLAERIGVSGILAAVAAGITMSRVELAGGGLAATRVQRAAVWDAVRFALNGIVFVLLGEQLPGLLRGAAASVAEAGHGNPWWLALLAIAISAGLMVLRFVWVWTTFRMTWLSPRGHGTGGPGWRLVAVTTLSGVRGAVTLAGVLTLPLLLPDGRAFPARDLAVFLAAAVILVWLLAATFVLPRLLVGLEVPAEAEALREEDLARQAAARAAVAAIERSRNAPGAAAAEAEIHARAAVRVMTLYEHRLDDATQAGMEAPRLREADRAERALRLAALHAERETIFELARGQAISDELARRLVREIDLMEARYT
ncbi:MAG: Na+/H+ antiporter [Xanthomonadales bacterium]|nr:Na+/H+ antiporter [Xanthomonadales bacterium]